ncbi:helix-turn-helix domain-containing protein [Magnetococcales bacterium HHB-1]
MFLTLKEAAEELRCSKNTLAELARAGEVPAAKIGRGWIFVPDDLTNWVRSRYHNAQKENSCPSVKMPKAEYGLSISATKEQEFDAVLKRVTNTKRKSTTTK